MSEDREYHEDRMDPPEVSRYFRLPMRYDSVTGEVFRKFDGEWKLVAKLK